jgi:hypothetical protein
MPSASVPVRFIYRSKSMIPLLTIIEGAGLWREEGIDVQHFELSDDAEAAEVELFDGQIDFIFGNHLSPYLRLSQGQPIVCLAQSENTNDIWVATRPDVTDLSMLSGKRILLDPLFDADGSFCGHLDGTRLLLLEMHGVNTSELDYLNPKSISDHAEAVREGEADACFVSPDSHADALRAGLRIHEIPPLPMVHSVTFTTSLRRLEADDNLAQRVIRVLLRGTHFLKTRKADTLELWKKPIAPFRTGHLERLTAHYDDLIEGWETHLYPRAESIINAHRLACMVYPQAKQVNPLELWDLHALRQVHDSGFTAKLWASDGR